MLVYVYVCVCNVYVCVCACVRVCVQHVTEYILTGLNLAEVHCCYKEPESAEAEQ